MNNRTGAVALAALVSVSSLACGEGPKPAAAPVAPVTPPVSEAAPAGSPDAGAAVALALPAGVPDSPAGHQLAWVLAAFTQPPDEASVTAHFAPSFTSQVPTSQVVQIFAQVGAQLSPLVIDRVTPGATDGELAVIAHADKPGSPAEDAPHLRIDLAVDATEQHQIAGLTLRPVLDAKPAVSWDDVQSRLKAIAPSVGFLAAEIAGNKCVPLSSLEPKKPLALGSAFKLYVLNTLASEVAAGKHTWDDPIAIEDAKKSLPSGDMRKEPAGKTFPARAYAEKMISVSDNTATDHLLAFVGRTAVEGAAKATGHATPARLVPFLSTRDLFAMKLTGTPEELKAYVAADVGHKRKLLEGFEQRDLSTVPLEENGWTKPRMIDSIEWLASPDDLCKLAIALKAQADAPKTAPVGAILAINPGIPDEKHLFKYVGFKGGSEPGVMNMTWLLQRKSDDKWLFLSVGYNDASNPIDEQKAATAASAARDFLGKP